MTEDNYCDSCGESSCSDRGENKEKPEEEIVQHSLDEAIDRREFAQSLGRIKHKIIVLSCKGGVGKSTVAVNLAMSLSLAGKKVGLLDVDLHGPSVPAMLGMEDEVIKHAGHLIMPSKYERFFKVMSLGFMLDSKDDAVIWRGPSKIAVIQQFLRDVYWDNLDVLIIDSPPGTGDEPLTVCQLIPEIDGAVIVTTSQDISITDVRKSVTFCRKIELPIIGVVENMSGMKCPHCSKEIDVFGSGGGEKMAKDMEVPFLGRIPLDPEIVQSGDKGKPFVYDNPTSDTAFAFTKVIAPILKAQEVDPHEGRPRGENPLVSG